MGKIRPLISLILVGLCILLLVNGASGLPTFFNSYSLVMFFFITYAMSIIKFGFMLSCNSLKMFLFVPDGDNSLQSIYQFQYKMSYMIGLACFVAGSIIILNDVDVETTRTIDLVHSLSINLLVIFYAIIYAEFFCRLNIK